MLFIQWNINPPHLLKIHPRSQFFSCSGQMEQFRRPFYSWLCPFNHYRRILKPQIRAQYGYSVTIAVGVRQH